MKLSEARKRWKHYLLMWREGAYDGFNGNDFAREFLSRDMSIDALEDTLHEYTKLADIHEENQSQLMGELEAFKKVNAEDHELMEAMSATITRLRCWVDDLHSEMYINCVYCGHRYGPDTKETRAMSEVLHAHVAVCPEHPLSAALAEIEQLKQDMEPFMAQITQAKTYTEADPPETYTIADYPSSGDMQEGEKDAP